MGRPPSTPRAEPGRRRRALRTRRRGPPGDLGQLVEPRHVTGPAGPTRRAVPAENLNSVNQFQTIATVLRDAERTADAIEWARRGLSPRTVGLGPMGCVTRWWTCSSTQATVMRPSLNDVCMRTAPDLQRVPVTDGDRSAVRRDGLGLGAARMSVGVPPVFPSRPRGLRGTPLARSGVPGFARAQPGCGLARRVGESVTDSGLTMLDWPRRHMWDPRLRRATTIGDDGCGVGARHRWLRSTGSRRAGGRCPSSIPAESSFRECGPDASLGRGRVLDPHGHRAHRERVRPHG